MLKRKSDDDTYPGFWDCVGGHLEKGESIEDCMVREAREESGLAVEVARPGSLIEYRDQYGRSIAIPFLLSSRGGNVVLSEHDQFNWVTPAQARQLKAVPALRMALDGFRL